MSFVRFLGVALAAQGLLSAVPALAGDAEVAALLARKAAIITNMHQKSSKGLVNFAQDQVFPAYFSAPADQRKDLKKRIDTTSQTMQATSKVEEMCLIDDKGQEISRIVGSAIAPDAELSPDEANNSFFKPSFARDPKQVYITPIYLSPDAKKWVVAYVTPLAVNGAKVAVLHYEYSLAEFQQALAKDVSGSDLYVLAVDKDGYVLADSRAPVAIDGKGEKKELADYFTKLPAAAAAVVKAEGEGKGEFADGGAKWRVAYKAVQDWAIAVVEKM
ncbi:MAG: cache domain-containing protein [Alphaproteobacteria bacterium]